mmetsp:Transcript_5989/g.7363  ORF Transcript_5989/g.7363 Transcript_5989/m.7363 type:complete len:366 (+) Transcript_5989:70-1167(+)
MSSSGGGDQWAWLGLLKWSLSYSDGTRPSEESMTPMSAEDKAFLESVMKDGIIDEGERMKFILKEMADALDVMKAKSEGDKDIQEKLSEDDMEDLLQELRDIVEQIDYARAFAAMKGIPFLLGCASERKFVPRSIRAACLGIVATMCQNNPAVQLQMLEEGSIPKLANIYFAEFPTENKSDEELDEIDGLLRTKAVQALSASIRQHATAEDLLCLNEDACKMIESALGMHGANETLPGPTPIALRKRSLFFLHALITSDTSSAERVRLFNRSIAYVADNFIDPSTESNSEIREMSISFLDQILKQKKSVNAVLSRKAFLAGLGVKQISTLRKLEGDEREFAAMELENWESLMLELARATPDAKTT